MGPKRKAKKPKRKKRTVTKRVIAPRQCSPGLSRLLSSGTESSLLLTPGDAIKQLWQVARSASLNQGGKIVCNDEMRRLFGCSMLTMLEVPSALAKHMSAAAASVSRPAAPALAAAQPASAGSRETERLLKLSPALTSLLCGGRGEGGDRQMMMTQKEALRRVGDYITQHRLRDTADRRKIHCDAALAEIVGKGTFSVYEARELLGKHLSEAAAARIAQSGSSSASSAGVRAGGSSNVGSALGAVTGAAASVGNVLWLRRRLLEARRAVKEVVPISFATFHLLAWP